MGTAQAKHLRASRHLSDVGRELVIQLSKSAAGTPRPRGTRALVVQRVIQSYRFLHAGPVRPAIRAASPKQLREHLDRLDEQMAEAERVRNQVTEQLRQLQPEPGTPSMEPYNGPERRQWPETRQPKRSR